VPNRIRIVLLCEDRTQENFFRRICKRLVRSLTVRIAPKGHGSAEQWVRDNFAKELKAYRSYGRERVGLVVVVDGDVEGVVARKKQLDEAAQTAGVKRRTNKERVAICVPTRNIETWIIALCRDGDITETDDYRNDVTSDEIRRAPDLWPSKTNACELPSYRDARRELARLDR
jgi:hypothetical protein